MKSSEPGARGSWSRGGLRAAPGFRPVGYWDGQLIFIRAAAREEPLDDSPEDEDTDDLPDPACSDPATAAPVPPGRSSSGGE